MIGDAFGTEEVWSTWDFVKLVSRLGIDLVFTWIVVSLVYGRLYRNRELIFTCYIFNVITLALCLLLRKVPMELGFALGLFAVFGILRYRTEEIRTRDLTYLFIVIGLAILNGVANKKISLAELLTVDVLIVAITAAIELAPRNRGSGHAPVLYDNLALLRPGREAELHADLGQRLGVQVVRVQVHRIDLLRDAAEITAHFVAAPAAAAAAAPKSDADPPAG
ncbi:MAG TPA: DUF4956 domain-containing protein [Kofleriaceae bacterium]|nr:DUF4956 domain-containing protein [Kofleriaceae bacterium]